MKILLLGGLGYFILRQIPKFFEFGPLIKLSKKEVHFLQHCRSPLRWDIIESIESASRPGIIKPFPRDVLRISFKSPQAIYWKFPHSITEEAEKSFPSRKSSKPVRAIEITVRPTWPHRVKPICEFLNQWRKKNVTSLEEDENSSQKERSSPADQESSLAHSERDAEPNNKSKSLFARAFTGWPFWLVVLPSILLAVFFGTSFFIDLSRKPISAELLSSQFKKAAFADAATSKRKRFIQKWDKPIRVVIEGDKASKLFRYTKGQFERLFGASGLDVKFVSSESAPANMKIKVHTPDFVDPTGAKRYRSLKGKQRNGRIDHINIEFFPKSIHDAYPKTLTSDSKQRKDFARQVFTVAARESFGLIGNLGSTKKGYKDKTGEVYWLPKILIAMLYDPRIQPGSGPAEALAIAEIIALEIEGAESFASWLEERKRLAGHWAFLHEDYASAFQHLQKRTSTNDPIDLFRLGLMYEGGHGTPQDYSAAVRSYETSAAQGFAPAQTNLGSLYYYGRGVPRNPEKAAEWYMKAANEGQEVAASNLCTMYRNGTGLPKDFAEAFKWCDIAASLGHAAAQRGMGILFRDGKGVDKDIEKAIHWFELAAHKQDAKAAFILARIYHKGRLVERDLESAIQLYRTAAKLGHKRAAKALKAIKGKAKTPAN